MKERKVGKMKITEKDVDEFLEFRRKFTELEWETLNSYVTVVLNYRKKRFVLTDSEVEEISNLIKSSHLFKKCNLRKIMEMND